MLSHEQIDAFWRDGYLVAENAASGEQLRRLQKSIHEWVEESRSHDAPFGEPTVDGRARFDMGEEHRAERPRGLFICVYTAADAFPLARNPMPSSLEGAIVRGEGTRVARLMQADIELPEQPKMASFFAVQGQASAGSD